MWQGQPGRSQGADAEHRCAVTPGRLGIGGERARERERLLAHVRADIIPGLEALVDPDASPADLIALADRQSRRLRAELECPDDSDALFGLAGVDDPACNEEREWVRGHLHDTALQILELVAGNYFGTGLTAEKIGHLAGGAARDLRRWIDHVGRPDAPELPAELERITKQACALDRRVELVRGEIGTPPTGDEVDALAGAVREAVTNARKHANASIVIVRLECDEHGHTMVTVCDNGIGFDLERAESGNGLGLRGSIVDRMKRVGGTASLEDAPGGGTLVTLVASRQGD